MNILVTGGTGFIGRYLVKELVKKNYNVKCLVRKTSDVSHLPKGVKLWYGDLTNPKSLNNIAKDIDIVIHLAAIGDINAISYKNYLQYKKVNVDGTRNLLEECKKTNIKKFIHFSSIAAMGVIRKDGKINKTDFCLPKNPYARSKYETEVVVKNSKIPYIILRPSMVYDWKNISGDLEILEKFINYGIVPVIGKGDKKIPMVSIDYLIDTVIFMIEHEIKNEIYLVNSDELSLKEIIFKMSEVLDKKPYILHIPVSIAKIIVKMLEYLAQIFDFVPLFTLERIESVTTDRVYESFLLEKSFM